MKVSLFYLPSIDRLMKSIELFATKVLPRVSGA